MSLQAKIVKKLLRFQFSGWSQGSIEEQRARHEKSTRLNRLPADVYCQRVSADGVAAEWIEAPGVDSGVILYLHAERLFKDLQISNIQVHIGDGSLGLPEFSPYDGILVTAAAPSVPSPPRRSAAPRPGGRRGWPGCAAAFPAAACSACIRTRRR